MKNYIQLYEVVMNQWPLESFRLSYVSDVSVRHHGSRKPVDKLLLINKITPEILLLSRIMQPMGSWPSMSIQFCCHLSMSCIRH